MPRKKIGLALSGGGARGFAHIGVLKVLAEHNIPIDFMAGTSAGAFAGGALAAGMSMADMEEMASAIRWRNVCRPSFSPMALLSNAPMAKLMRRHFPVQRFENLSIPFAAVACDPVAGELVVLKNGDLITAIQASCAVPAVFTPVRINGRLLADGGIMVPMPVDIVREMGADLVIAVDLLSSGASFRRNTYTAFGMLFSSALTIIREVTNKHDQEADLTIIPQIGHIRPDRLDRTRECLELGEKAAREGIEEIKSLISDRQPGQLLAR